MCAAGPRRVFISHTSELAEHPQRRSFVDGAVAGVHACRDAPVRMKYFPAADQTPAAVCTVQVQECTVFVAVIGFRYGSPVRDHSDLSYVEWEFEAATQAGLTRLIFLLDDAVDGLPRTALFDPDFDDRQQQFRQRLKDCGVTVRMVRSPEELELAVNQALAATADPRESVPSSAADGGGRVAAIPAMGPVWGRETEVATVVTAVTEASPEPVAVLGPPGIGKSTVCMAALHDPAVAARYGARRWFVRCDGAEDAAGLVTGTAAELGVIADPSGVGLRPRVLAELGAAPAVVVLDNLETPWVGDPLGVEDVLRSLASVTGLGVVVTVRGAARPGGLRWRDPVLVGPLGAADARLVFLSVAGSEFGADPTLDGLLAELDGVPLAVELLGYAAQGQPDLADLARRWERERVVLLQRFGGMSRELSVSVSVELSVAGPLMTEPARRLFTMLGQLPNGIAGPDLDVLLPHDGPVGAATLRQMGLAFDEDGRLRMLAPIREHAAAQHPPTEDDQHQLITHYCTLASTQGGQVGSGAGSAAVTRLTAESGNLRRMILTAVERRDVEHVVDAVTGMVEYGKFAGADVMGIIGPSISMVAAADDPRRYARLQEAAGSIAMARSDHEGARERFEAALPLYRRVGAVLGEANCIQGLGDIALRRSDHEGARERFEAALRLYKRIREPYSVGMANRRLARLATSPDRAAAFVVVAREAWESIGREDLVGQLDAEFG